MQPNQKLKQSNNDVYTKKQKTQIKSIKEIEKHHFPCWKHQKNRNILLSEELYIITKYIKKATTKTGASQRTQSPAI